MNYLGIRVGYRSITRCIGLYMIYTASDLRSSADMLKKMIKQYNEYAKEPRDMQDQGVHNEADLPMDDTACSYMKQHGEYWQPWK